MTELLLPLGQESRRTIKHVFKESTQRTRGNGDANRLDSEDRPAHGWYRFVLSFPPHLVRHYLHQFDANGRLDP